MADHLKRGVLLGGDHAELCQTDPVDPAQRGQIAVGALLDRDEHSPSAFGEQPDERIRFGRQLDACPRPVPQRGLDYGLHQPAIGEVMGTGEQSAAARPDEHLRQRLFLSKINRGGSPPR